MKLSRLFYSSLLTISFFLATSPLRAATITPNIFTDPAIGADNLNCSLRYAVEAINQGSTASVPGCAAVGGFGSNDTIILGEGTYTLTLAGVEDDNETGDLDILDNVQILGAGSGLVTIDASGIPEPDRVIQVFDASEVTIEGVTLTGGDVIGNPSDQRGGGLWTTASMIVLRDVVVVDNAADVGGGIAVLGGSSVNMLMENSTVDQNRAFIDGGGIYIEFVNTVGISHSTISRNETEDDGVGGGIFDASEYLFLTNSTVSSNTTQMGGGGIYSLGGLKGVYNVTVAFNAVTESFGEGGGGVLNQNCCGQDDRFDPEIFNTIIARNTIPVGTPVQGPDCLGEFLSGGYNLIGNRGEENVCDGFSALNDDQVGTPEAPIDPLLGPLANNGGNTQTHALLEGSPAIDRGNPDGCVALDVANFIENDDVNFNTLTDDQRGLTRPVAILDPDVAVCDVGAYELQIPEPTPTPTPTPTATPVPPPFNAFLEGSGCALTGLGSGSATGFGSMALLALVAGWVHWRLRRQA